MEAEANNNVKISKITTTLEYEFTKYLLKSAEKEFQNLDGPTERGKYTENTESRIGAVGSLGEILGFGVGSAVATTKTVVEAIDKIIQKRKKIVAINIIDSNSSESFQTTFRQLFIQLALNIYHSYEIQLQNVYLKVGGSKSSKSQSLTGDRKGEDQRQAIQILATYAGAKCFDYMMESKSKENLLQGLTIRKKFEFEKLSAWWKSWTEEKLYYYAFKPKGSSGSGSGSGSGSISGSGFGNANAYTNGNGESMQKQYISAYKFFRDTVPVFWESHSSPRDLSLSLSFSLRKYRIRTRDLKKKKSLKFNHKLRRPLDFELQMQDEFEFVSLESHYQEVLEVDNFSGVGSYLLSVEEIEGALLHDESYSWNQTLLAEVRDLISVIEEHRKLTEDTNIKVTEATEEIKETKEIVTIGFEETVAKIDAVGAKLEFLSARSNKILPSTRIRFNVTEPIETFTGREQYLKDLHDEIQKSRDEAGNPMTVLSQTSVITGLGGIGKTETVRMYIHRYGSNYDHVVWIDAEQHSTAEAQIRKLANHELKIPLTDSENNRPEELKTILKQVYQKLCPNGNLLLLVFDNAESLDNSDQHSDGIRRFLPQSLPPSFVKPAILITSRNREWGQQRVIQLGLWSEEECITFLLQQLKLEDTVINRELTTELGKLFGRFPLALQSAVAVISQQSKRQRLVGGGSYGIRELINDYNNGKRDVLTKQPLDSSSKTTMLVLWNVSLEKIRDHDHGELAIKILHVMAYLSSTVIPKDLLRAMFEGGFGAFGGDQDNVKDNENIFLADALELLCDYSLVESFRNHFTVHRMIQDVVIEHLRTNVNRNSIINSPDYADYEDGDVFLNSNFSKENAVLISLTQNLRKYLPTVSKSSVMYDEVMCNIIHVTNYVSNKLYIQEFLEFTEYIADEIIEIRMKEAGIHFENLVAYSTNINGPRDKKTQKYRHQLAYLCYLRGKFQEALQSYSELLQEQEAQWGPKDLDTLTTKNSMAMVLYRQGKYNTALKIFSEVLKIREKVLGPSNTCTLQTKNNLAMVLRKQGNYDEALRMCEDVLEVREKELGSIHLDTLTTKYNIALVMNNQGKYDKAKKIYSEVLQVFQKELGSIHPETLTAKNNLASVMNNQGRYNEAMKMTKEVLEIREKELGPYHPDTLTTKNNVALILNNQGKYDEAMKIHSEVLEVRVQELGYIHPDTLETKHNLAMVFKNLGKYEKAMEMYSEVLEMQEKELGSSHPHSLGTKINIALVMTYQGKYDEAMKMYCDVLEVRQKVHGPSHATTLATKNNIALVLVNQGKCDDAMKMYSDVLEVREKVLGPNHPITLKTKQNMAKVLDNQGKYEEAMKMNLEILEVRERILGPFHPSTLLTKTNIAKVLKNQGKYDEALATYFEVLHVKKKVFGPSHPMTLVIKNYIALVMDKQGKHEEAMKVYQAVLYVNQTLLGPRHPSTLVTKNGIAMVLTNQEKFAEAKKMYLEVLEASEIVLGPSHPETLNTKHMLACLYLKMGDYENSERISEEVMKLREQLLGTNHPDYKKTKDIYDNSQNMTVLQKILQGLQTNFVDY